MWYEFIFISLHAIVFETANCRDQRTGVKQNFDVKWPFKVTMLWDQWRANEAPISLYNNVGLSLKVPKVKPAKALKIAISDSPPVLDA